MIKDQTRAHNIITLETLARRVTGAVRRILDVRPSESSWHLPRTEIKPGFSRADLPDSSLADR